MLADILAILWKEWRELFRQRTSRSGLFNWAVIVFILGVFVPLQSGLAWVGNPLLLIVWSWPPILSVIWIVADSFAGEKERHTLETLLASRLPDTAILFGKLILALLYGLSTEIGGLLLGLVVVNLAHPGPRLLLYPANWVVDLLALCLACLLLISSIGTLISLHSDTVRSASQKLTLAMLALLAIPSLGSRLLPQGVRNRLEGSLAVSISSNSILVAAGVIALIGSIILAFAMVSFRRPKLILD